MNKGLPQLSDAQLDKMFKGCPYYGGTFSKDQLPSTEDLNGKFVIVNMEDHDKGNGTHWVGLYDVDPKTISYFDSEGCPPPKSVAKIMRKSGKTQHWNNMQLQKLGSDSCGWWTTRAMNALMEGYTLTQFAKMYNLKDQDVNESLLKSQFNK